MQVARAVDVTTEPHATVLSSVAAIIIVVAVAIITNVVVATTTGIGHVVAITITAAVDSSAVAAKPKCSIVVEDFVANLDYAIRSSGVVNTLQVLVNSSGVD